MWSASCKRPACQPPEIQKSRHSLGKRRLSLSKPEPHPFGALHPLCVWLQPDGCRGRKHCFYPGQSVRYFFMLLTRIATTPSRDVQNWQGLYIEYTADKEPCYLWQRRISEAIVGGIGLLNLWRRWREGRRWQEVEAAHSHTESADQNNNMSIHTGHRENSLITDFFLARRGVTQGGPITPILVGWGG